MLDGEARRRSPHGVLGASTRLPPKNEPIADVRHAILINRMYRPVSRCFGGVAALISTTQRPAVLKNEKNWSELYSSIEEESLTALQAIRKACLSNDIAELERLVRESAIDDLDAEDEAGLTSLKYACMAGSEGCASILLEHEAMVDHTSRVGVTALHEACRAGQARVVELLLQHGANVNHVNDTGHSPLMFASIRGCDKCASLLCAHGAHRSTRTYELGLSAADYARKLRHPLLASWLDGNLDALAS